MDRMGGRLPNAVAAMPSHSTFNVFWHTGNIVAGLSYFIVLLYMLCYDNYALHLLFMYTIFLFIETKA